MGILRKLAFEVIRMIDAGEFNTDITDSEIELISAIIHRPLTVGREEAAKYIGVSLSRFHELKDFGIIAEPRKVRGFKEKAYYVSDLKKSLELKAKHGL